MEIKALLNSSVTDAAQYARTRLLRWPIAALWALLLVTLVAADSGVSPARLATQAAFLAVTVALLRLWDDLADLDHDRRRHPERVLVTTANLGSFVALLVVGLGVVALVLLGDAQRFTIYGVLLIALLGLYRIRSGANLPRAIAAYLLLAKYPVLIFLAGVAPTGQAWLAGLSLYVLLGIYEWYDDGELRAAPLRQVLLGGVAGVAIVCVLFLTAGERP